MLELKINHLKREKTFKLLRMNFVILFCDKGMLSRLDVLATLILSIKVRNTTTNTTFLV
jgi:hypothetical protein